MNKVHQFKDFVEVGSRRLALLIAILFIFLFSAVVPVEAQKLLIEKRMRYLQPGQRAEWDAFAKQVPQKTYSTSFLAQENQQEQSLRVRQYDVKQSWNVFLNEHLLGNLTIDENDLTIYLPVPAHTLQDGINKLRIEPSGDAPDDIAVGAIWLENKPVQKLLSACTLSVQVWDKSLDAPVPSRLTISNREGSLQTIGAQSNDSLAVRSGIVYTSTGKASFTLPEGTYTIYATRGLSMALIRQRLS